RLQGDPFRAGHFGEPRLDVFGTRDTRVYDVDGNPVRAQLIGESLREVHQGGVAHAAHRLGAAGRKPPDIDDTTPFGRTHVRHAILAHAKVADQFGVQVQEQR